MGVRSPTAEQLCAALASRSHGIVTRSELLSAGLTRREIERRRERGYLIVEFPGVYRVGHTAPSLEARYLAAVRACGAEAALSGGAAAHLYGLVSGPAPIPHVTAPRKRHVRGVSTRRSRRIERATYRRIPVTTVARTLLDLAASLSPADLARACHEAGVRYPVAPRHVQEVLEAHPNAAGVGRLRMVLRGETPVTQSALERRFLGLLAANGLAPPDQTNAPAGSFRVDCRWSAPPLTVELDSYRFHNSRHAWKRHA
jgi:hypothetical protein